MAFPGDVGASQPFWRVVRNLPSLCDGELVSCDIAWNGAESASYCVAKFAASPIPSRVLERITFWVLHCGGSFLDTDGAPAPGSTERITFWDDVRASLVPSLADAFTHDSEQFVPHLFVDLDQRDSELMHLTLDSTTIFLQSPISPPLGDAIPLAYDELTDRRRVDLMATVTGRVLTATSARQGFILEVSGNAPFAEWAAKLPARRGNSPWHRRDERVPVRVSGMLQVERGELLQGGAAQVLVENLSRSGALIVCEPSPSTGSHVTLRFPLGGMDMALRGTVVRNGPDGTGIQFDRDPFANFRLAVELERLSELPLRALVIDDNVLVRSMLTEALEQRGFAVTSASDGDSGVRILRDQQKCMNAVITDICMPGLSGEDLVRTLRLIAGRDSFPIVGMTGSASSESVRRIEQAGVDIVLFKSVGAQSIADTAAALARWPIGHARQGTSAAAG